VRLARDAEVLVEETDAQRDAVNGCITCSAPIARRAPV
jgi:hypothetical protein